MHQYIFKRGLTMASDEPSQSVLVYIINIAKKRNVQYILFEQNASSSLTEVIQEELGAMSLTLSS